MKRMFSFAKREEGSVIIEAVFAMGTLILLLLGIMEFSRALYADIFIGYAAHSATRYAMVRGATWSPKACTSLVTASCTAAASDIATFVKSIAPLGVDTSSNLNISTIWPGTSASGGSCVGSGGPASPGCVVQVRLTYTFHFILPVVSSTPLLLQSSSAVTIAQ